MLAVFAHPLQVSARLGTARFGQLGEREDSHIPAFQGEQSHARANANAQFGRMERLRDEVVGPRAQALDDVVGPVARGNENNVHVAREVPFSNSAAQFEPVHLRHFPVGNDQAKDARAQDFERFPPVPCRTDFVAGADERFAQQVSCDFIVVDNQDTH